ncbi:hypothetical protein AMTR_s00118p00122390 [Amborella trichopoda]|uniref:Uncharacterized protein n=1 Tax=Amborella trichopoda TaxID=13333 RepID=W1NSP9_AMBTC|nr:hypothetical protein AMTR_s00118p00122390 [Amborella trichopoda]
MTLLVVIDDLSLEYNEKRTELDKWCQEYLANLANFWGLEGYMAEVRGLIERLDPVVTDIVGCIIKTSHPSQDP